MDGSVRGSWTSQMSSPSKGSSAPQGWRRSRTSSCKHKMNAATPSFFLLQRARAKLRKSGRVEQLEQLEQELLSTSARLVGDVAGPLQDLLTLLVSPVCVFGVAGRS